MGKIKLTKEETITLSLEGRVLVERDGLLFIILKNENVLFVYEVQAVSTKVELFKFPKSVVVNPDTEEKFKYPGVLV